MVDSALTPEERDLFEASRKAVAERQAAKLAREQALSKFAEENGLDKTQATAVFTEMERRRKAEERRVKTEQAALKREQDAATQKVWKAEAAAKRKAQTQQKREQDAAAQKVWKAEAAAKRKAQTQQKREQRTVERRQQRRQDNFKRAVLTSVGVSSSGEVLEDWLSLLVWWSAFTASTMIIGPLGGLFQAVDGAWDNFSSSRLGQMAGFGGSEASDKQSTANQLISSPLPGISLEQLIEYQPLHGQSFGPETGNQRDYGPHAGIDFDCTVGGCAGADVAAIMAGTVTAIEEIAASSNGSSYRVVVTAEDWLGQVEHRYVHVDSLTVKKSDKVSAGQIFAKVSPTDSVSTGPHLDLKIWRNGSWVNPQGYLAEAMQNMSGGSAAETIAAEFMTQAGIEGFHAQPYWDYAQWSWGHGTKAPCNSVAECRQIRITPEQARADMLSYLANYCSPLLAGLSLSDNQQAATLSLCYNLGPDQFQKSEPYVAMQNGDMNTAIASFDRYVHADSIRLAGLVKRRNLEQQLWGMPNWQD
ncbi:MAG: peptidoglycan DD-metalloendopeptidase family protein [Cyanobacteria bacterium P01_C01_bin.121]